VKTALRRGRVVGRHGLGQSEKGKLTGTEFGWNTKRATNERWDERWNADQGWGTMLKREKTTSRKFVNCYPKEGRRKSRIARGEKGEIFSW